MIQLLRRMFKNKNNRNCQFKYKQLYFFGQNVAFCSNGNPSQQRKYPIIYKNFNGNIDIKDLLKKIEKVRKNVRKGIFPAECEGCHLIKEVDEADSLKIDFIQFSDYCLCNSRCIYCNSWRTSIVQEDGRVKSSVGISDSYNIIPIINILISKKLITQNTAIGFAGGEPTVYQYFEDALKLLLDFGIKQIKIYSNVIRYSEQIARGLNMGVVDLTVSVDAGTKEIHKKVKGVESYELIYENLKRYLQIAKNKSQIVSKYVIVPEINDLESEIEKWILKSKEIGVKKLEINLDDRVIENGYNSELMYKINTLNNYFINKSKENNIDYDICANCLFARDYCENK